MPNPFAQFDDSSKENPFAQFHKVETATSSTDGSLSSRIGNDISNRQQQSQDVSNQLTSGKMNPLGAWGGQASSVVGGIGDVGAEVGKSAWNTLPNFITKPTESFTKYLGENFEKTPEGVMLKAITPIAKEQYEKLDPNIKAWLGLVGNTAKTAPIVEGGMAAANLAKLPLKGVREGINTASDAMAKKVPLDKENTYIVKALQKEGHSPQEIVDIMNRVKTYGMTVGEASGNPKLLGIERKIAGMSKPGGALIRDVVKNRIDPNNNVSMPYQLKSVADPLVKEVDRASKEIGSIVESAPKTPMNMNAVENSLAKEKRPPKSIVTNTLSRIDGLVEWAKTQGNDYAAWHRVKQEIYNLKNEAKDPNTLEKLDTKTISTYYKKVNDVLSGKAAGLPEDLRDTAAKYAKANDTFAKNISGRTIQDVLEKMPTGGTPASSLKYLYKQLAGSKELQEELFAGMPEEKRAGMMKLLEAIKDSGRSSVSDVVKSMEEGSPSFPLSKTSIIAKATNAIQEALTRKDWNSLAKALTSPDAETIAKKLGFIKQADYKERPILRLTYQPEYLGTKAGVKAATPAETASNAAVRERMKGLGLDLSTLKAQDFNTIRALEKKYGQSELGRFMIAHKNEPIMSKIWEVPNTEYSKATVDKMLNNALRDKLDKAAKAQLESETKKAWESGQFSLAEIVMANDRAAKELAAAGIPKGKFGHTNVGDVFMNSLKSGDIPSSVGQSFDDMLKSNQ